MAQAERMSDHHPECRCWECVAADTDEIHKATEADLGRKMKVAVMARTLGKSLGKMGKRLI